MNELGVPMVARYGNGGGHGRRISVENDGPLTDAPIAKKASTDRENRIRSRHAGAGFGAGGLAGMAASAASGTRLVLPGALAGLATGVALGERKIRRENKESKKKVGKAFIPQFKNAFRPLNAPGAVKGKTGKLVQARVAETVTTAPKVAASVAATSLYAAHKTGTMEKRDRTYDPEARRQVRRGVAAGGMGVMGAGAVGIGVRNIRASTKELAANAPKGPAPAADKGGKATAAAVKTKLRRIGSVGRGRDQALVAGGAAALTAATRMQQNAGNNRKRGWS